MKATPSIRWIFALPALVVGLALSGCSEADDDADDDTTPQPTPGDDDDDDTSGDDDTSDDDTSDDDDSVPTGSDEWDTFAIDLGLCAGGEASVSLDWDTDTTDIDLYVFDALDPEAKPLIAGELYQPPDPPHEGGEMDFLGPVVVQAHCYSGAGAAYTLTVELTGGAGRGDDDSAAGDDDSAAPGDDDSSAGGDDDSSNPGDDDDDVVPTCSADTLTIAEVEPNDGQSETDMQFLVLDNKTIVITGTLDLCPN